MKLYYEKNLKGLPALRVIIFATITMMAFMYGAIFFAGGYLSTLYGSNSSALASQYGALGQNQTHPGGGLFNITNLSKSTHNGVSNYSTNNFSISLSGVIGSITTFTTVVPNLLNTMFYYVGSVFQLFHIPSTFFIVLGQIMILAVFLIIIITLLGVVYV